eukprot:s2611_g6.t1
MSSWPNAPSATAKSKLMLAGHSLAAPVAGMEYTEHQNVMPDLRRGMPRGQSANLGLDLLETSTSYC